MSEISVRITKFTDRKFWLMYYDDPITGKRPDIDCNSLTSPSTYTGPNEVWWAPYDNRPGSNVTQTVDDIRRRFGRAAIGPARLAHERGVRSFRDGEQQWGPGAGTDDS